MKDATPFGSRTAKASSRVWVPFGLLLGACGAPGSVPEILAPDLVLVNGIVLTVDADDSVEEAVAIKDGKILAVGSTEEVEALAGASTRRVDLSGRTATPGLLDAHAHFAGGAVDRLYVLDLSYPEVQSIADVVAKVAEQVEVVGPGEWIQGRGWDEGKLEELRYILASDLDLAAPDNPVWLTHTMGHYGVGNSLALRRAGITVETSDPPGGTIDREPDGTPTGVLKESAQSLVRRLIAGASGEQLREGIADLARAFNAEGMTGVKDPGIGARQWAAYRDVLARGDLTVRVFALWRSPETLAGAEELTDGIGSFTRPYVTSGDDRLVSGGVKLYVDGSGGARTAWLYDEWNREGTAIDEGNRGYPAMNPDTLREIIRLYHDAGLHVSTHSIGDRGIDWVVDSYARALEANPQRGLRHGIIHANIPSDRAIRTMARLQREFDAAIPEPSPGFTWWIGDTYAGNFGPERAVRLNPFRTFVENGIRWASGSDFSVTPFPARYGLWASTERRPLLGVYGDQPFGIEEAVDVRAALRSYTIWAAGQMFLDDVVGSIEPGKYADIAVWDRNPYAVDPGALRDLVCEMTLFEGSVVYRREGSDLGR
jgi:predicted amidohydrolase YtcJ